MGYVMEELIFADYRFKPELYPTDDSILRKQYRYRSKFGIWAVKHCISVIAGKKELSLDHNLYYMIAAKEPEALKDTRKVEFLLKNSSLTERQHQCIRMCFYDGMKYEDIGKSFKPVITKQAVREHIMNAVNRMKEVAGLK